MTEHVDVKVKVLDARLAIQSLTTAIEAYDSLLPIPRTLIFEHLQEMHGLALDGEWHHAPTQWRENNMSRENLKHRHNELHEEDVWNEASERHSHEERVHEEPEVQLRLRRAYLQERVASGTQLH